MKIRKSSVLYGISTVFVEWLLDPGKVERRQNPKIWI